MSALTKAKEKCNAATTVAFERADHLKQRGELQSAIAPNDLLSGLRQAGGADRFRLSLFRGWVYAAIHAIASEGAQQPFTVARRTQMPTERGARLARRKAATMPPKLKSHASTGELEVIPDSPLAQGLSHPNPSQSAFSFAYMFIANLNLTGWGYVVGGEQPEGNGMEFYAVPTTWITPKHKDGPFSSFILKDPGNPGSKGIELGRENVGFAHLPNPADPFGAVAPAGAQMQAIRIDDHIQASQEQFFDNGIFPSVIVEMGKDPHPEVSGGIRPRLSASQRRQVTGAIRKVMGGVANMGNPAIVDGLIENIRTISHTHREMGWEKSEERIVDRILSSFGVHRYILGHAVQVGGYAQAAKIEERFCKRVNLFLGMLGSVVGGIANKSEGRDDLVVWYEECAPHDPALHWTNVRELRKNGDITKNEVRAMLGLSDVEEEDDEARNKLLESVGGLNGALNLLQQVGRGLVSADAAARLLALFLEREESEMREIVGATGDQAQGRELAEELSRLVDQMKEPVKITRG